MKAKRWLCLILTLVMLTGSFCGCGDDETSIRDDDNDERSSSTTAPKDQDPTDPDAEPTDPITDPSNPDEPSAPSTDSGEQTNTLDMSRISDAGDFSEGLAFIRLDDSYEKTYCINKKGEVVFTLEGNYQCGTFHNGYAFVYDSPEYNVTNVYLCDTEGNLTSPADLGATSFVRVPYISGSQPYHCFFGDYILVIHTNSTFTGSTDELGILNCDLEYIVEPSAKLFDLYQNYYKHSNTKYYDGYLYRDGRYLDLRTGQEGTDLNNMYAEMNIQFQSDFWNFSSTKYIDQRNNSTAIDLSQYKETLDKAGSFENGTASLLFRSESATGVKYYFTIIDEDGQFKFDPYELPYATYSIYTDKNNYLLVKKTNTREGYTLSMYLFDESGIVAQVEKEYNGTYSFVSITDDVIRVNTFGNGNYFYTLDFEPLF